MRSDIRLSFWRLVQIRSMYFFSAINSGVKCEQSGNDKKKPHRPRYIQALSTGEAATMGRRVWDGRIFRQHGGENMGMKI